MFSISQATKVIVSEISILRIEVNIIQHKYLLFISLSLMISTNDFGLSPNTAVRN